MRTFIVAAFFMLLLPSQEDINNKEATKELPLPKSAQVDWEWYQREVEKANIAWLVKMNDNLTAVRKKLEARQVDSTKAGNLEEALAIKAKLDSLPREYLLGLDGQPLLEKKDGRLVKIEPKKEPDVSDLEKQVIGEWLEIATGKKVNIKSDNTCTTDRADTGKWSIKDNKLISIWSDGYTHIFQLPAVNNSLYKNGKAALTRIQPGK
jgi:hypothetical protein